MAVDEYRIPTSGTVAGYSHAPLLMDGLEADMAAVIPPVKSRKEQR
ncbi:hypothetical protein [Treponema endosymbiont of Eucomonympha sp.]|nr:hypothetical protein [Treponema endosymbiont of Eucomonympha sp.]